MTAREITEQLQVFTNYLKEHGLKLTRQRRVVVESFLEATGHLSTDELFSLVRKKDPRVGLATVFRTVKALTDCGLARESRLGDGVNRFEHAYRRPNHHHIVCDDCGRTIEFISPELEQLQEQIVAEYGFKSVLEKIQITGACQDPQCEYRLQKQPQPLESDLIFARDALRIALETEKRGINFYRCAAKIVSDAATRKIFLEMLEDERDHLANLEKEWRQLVRRNKRILDAPVFLHFDYGKLREIFPSGEEVQSQLDRELTAEKALRLAMQMEKDAHDFFLEYAEKFKDTRGKDIFLQFATEEQNHYQTIREAYESLATSTA